MGGLLLLSGAFLSEKLRLNDLAVFGCGGLFFFTLAPFCEQINWNEWLPAPADPLPPHIDIRLAEKENVLSEPCATKSAPSTAAIHSRSGPLGSAPNRFAWRG